MDLNKLRHKLGSKVPSEVIYVLGIPFVIFLAVALSLVLHDGSLIQSGRVDEEVVIDTIVSTNTDILSEEEKAIILESLKNDNEHLDKEKQKQILEAAETDKVIHGVLSAKEKEQVLKALYD
tara:strand:+ start:202 stop:567 length:366 start_codon:yes stop_codon:yes gene_type:complete